MCLNSFTQLLGDPNILYYHSVRLQVLGLCCFWKNRMLFSVVAGCLKEVLNYRTHSVLINIAYFCRTVQLDKLLYFELFLCFLRLLTRISTIQLLTYFWPLNHLHCSRHRGGLHEQVKTNLKAPSQIRLSSLADLDSRNEVDNNT